MQRSQSSQLPRKFCPNRSAAFKKLVKHKFTSTKTVTDLSTGASQSYTVCSWCLVHGKKLDPSTQVKG